VVQQVVSRSFYAREDTWRPMILGTVVALGVIPLYLVLRERHGVDGLAIAGVLAMSANALAILVWARLRHGAPRLLPLVEAFGRMLLVAVPAAWAAAAALQGGEGRIGAALDLALGGAVFWAISLGGVFAWGDDATRDVLRSLARRVRGAR
jgi:peptidoglycan biosynthesis protein MviN/MurJ (putative lipid II flippase)